MPAPSDQNARGPKRRRVGEREESAQYQSTSGSEDNSQEEPAGNADTTPQANQNHGPVYDPHQSLDERRELRKNLRELDKEMQDSRDEWMAPESRGLQDAVEKQNVLFGGVKQTSDATIDSRMLVNAGDMTYKRTRNMNVGDNAQGIDIDEFVGKCMTFMREGDGEHVSSTQRRHGIASNEEDVEDDEAQGNALDWSFLGTHACFPSNVRPPTIGFMLGPLSVQKRPPRQPTQRRERLQKSGPVESVKAKNLQPADLDKQESAGVAAMCRRLQEEFVRAIEDGTEMFREYWDKKDSQGVSEAEQQEFEDYNWMMNDGGVNFFKFVINPESFAQSCENLFYLSFLIRDDLVQLMFDQETEQPSLRE